jgi:hypothetical protein
VLLIEEKSSDLINVFESEDKVVMIFPLCPLRFGTK